MSSCGVKYDLEERTASFGASIIELCKAVRQDVISKPIINQLVRSGTSVGANYMEANSACSRRDFKNKVYICKKEVQETKHWLRMVVEYDSSLMDRCAVLLREAQELTLIFGKIVSTMKKTD